MRLLLVCTCALAVAACAQNDRDPQLGKESIAKAGKEKTSSAIADVPTASRAFCTCNRRVINKNIPRMQAMQDDPVEQIPAAQMAEAMKAAMAVGEDLRLGLDSCRSQLAHFIRRVEQDTTLARNFGEALEACMEPILKKNKAALEAYDQYLDKLSQRQHQVLEQLSK